LLFSLAFFFKVDITNIDESSEDEDSFFRSGVLFFLCLPMVAFIEFLGDDPGGLSVLRPGLGVPLAASLLALFC